MGHENIEESTEMQTFYVLGVWFLMTGLMINRLGWVFMFEIKQNFLSIYNQIRGITLYSHLSEMSVKVTFNTHMYTHFIQLSPDKKLMVLNRYKNVSYHPIRNTKR